MIKLSEALLIFQQQLQQRLQNRFKHPMSQRKNKSTELPPFHETVTHSMQLKGVDINTALADVQRKYDAFKDRNQAMLERQDDQANKAQVQLISHFALLATLSLTVTGLLITQTAQNLTDPHKIIILVILSSEVLSLYFGSKDYRQTIKFHNRWAKTYHEIDKEVNAKYESGELQMISDLGKIEHRHTSEMDRETSKFITSLMIYLCFLGLILLVILFFVYFFDIPYWR